MFHQVYRMMERTDVLPAFDIICRRGWRYGRVTEMCREPRLRGVMVTIILIVKEEVGVVRKGRGWHQGGQGAGRCIPCQDRIQWQVEHRNLNCWNKGNIKLSKGSQKTKDKKS